MLRAQAPARPAGNLAFEVASVKPDTSNTQTSVAAPPGRFIAINAPLATLLSVAYQLPWFRIVDGPDWISGRFDVSAKMPDGAGPEQLRPMLQRLLAERFLLKAHRDTRDQPVYALVLARTDGRFGPQLRRSTVDCAARRSQRVAAGARGADLATGADPSCDVGVTPGQLRLRGVPLDALSNWLSTIVGDRVVVDRTGLTGTFDADLQYAAQPGGVGPHDAPSVFTAVQEQLGLKLEPSRAAVDVLVIDSVRRPAPD